MKTRTAPKPRGVALMDCLVYMTLLAIILGLAFSAFLETVARSTELDYIATSTVQALHAGEQWREDVRQAQASPRLVTVDGKSELQIRTANELISYAVENSVLRRRAGAQAVWRDVLTRVKASQFSADARKFVTAWRWDVELETREDRKRSSRVFTFQSVPRMTKP